MQEDRWISNPEEVKNAFKNHFVRFFQKNGQDLIFDIAPLISSKLTGVDNEYLESNFSLGELYEALQGISSNKSSGPDGINSTYLKELWNVISEDICDMASSFHECNILLRGLNSSFIVLIPKKENPFVGIRFQADKPYQFLVKDNPQIDIQSPE